MKNIQTAKKQNLSYAVLGLALVACSNSGSNSSAILDGGASQSTFSMKFSTASVGALAKNASSASNLGNIGIALSSGFINVKDISIRLPEGLACKDATFADSTQASCIEKKEIEDGQEEIESKIKINGPFIFDLAKGTSDPAIADITIPSGVYKRIRLNFEPSKVEGPMLGKTLLAQGTYVKAGVTKDFSVDLAFEEELKIRNNSDMTVAEGIKNALSVTINASRWFVGLDLNACLESGDLEDTEGSLHLDEHSGKNSCEKIGEMLKSNFDECMDSENEKEDEIHDDDSNSSDDDSSDGDVSSK